MVDLSSSTVVSGIQTYFKYVGSFAIFATILFLVLFRLEVLLYLLVGLLVVFLSIGVVIYDWQQTVSESGSTIEFNY